jgi:exodeoxyribonuclease V
MITTVRDGGWSTIRCGTVPKILIPTTEQDEVLDAVRDWYRNGNQTLTFGGYAGVGKTTLLGMIPQVLEIPLDRILFASFTGKAVSVMRSKLPKAATCSTLHKALYTPRQKLICTESGEDIGGFLLFQCKAHQGRTWQEELGHEFNEQRKCDIKRVLDFSPVMDPLDGYSLVVVDEASMVGEKIWSDLTKWGVPVLAVGDHGQLPPVRDSFNLMANPQLKLEKILRQAEKSPIIRMATLARTTGHIPIAEYGSGCVKLPPFKQMQALQHLHPGKGDLALCSFNKTRNAVNTRLRRRHLGEIANGPDPAIGDIVICLRNSYEQGVFNGMRGRITGLGPVQDYFEHPQRFASIDLLDDDYEFGGEIATEQFNQPKTMSSEVRRSVGLWDYGYAMTVHKSQGSQADRVLVIEERFPHDGDEFHARLLYTAVTRAIRSLCVVGPA